jgi:CDP-diacylglycerol--glycerol-3-phosphate 3-phosphatidyltransferase
MPATLSPSTRTALVAAAVVSGLLVAYFVRSLAYGRRSDARVARVGRSPLAGMWLVEAFYWAIQAPGRLCFRLGVSPDVLTWASLLLGLASLPVIALGHLEAGGVLFIFSTVADALDGLVARLDQSASDCGEVLDAVIDRYVDAAPLIGLAMYYRASLIEMSVPLAALVGSFMLSYNRAKAETFALELPSTAMRRHERTIALSLALILGPTAGSYLAASGLAASLPVLGLVGLMAIITNYAAMRLAAQARVALRRRDSEVKHAR